MVRGNDTLTVPGVQRLVNIAHIGLPIIFSGGLPQNLTGYNKSGTAYVRSELAGLLNLNNVHVVPYENLATSLQDLGLTPRTRVNADRLWYTYWREDKNTSTSYIFIYNDAWDSELGEGRSSGSITFETTGVPYTYDAWTGQVSQILAYQQTDTTTTLSLAVAGNQSAIIAFRHDETTSTGTRILSMPAEVFTAVANRGGSVAIKAPRTTGSVLLSNGKTTTLPIPAQAMNLENWTLTIESWTQPSNSSADQTTASKSNSTHHLTSLQPWNQISGSLRHVSGRGFYSTTFTWPPSHRKADGAVLDLGVIVHTAKVWVNGHQLPPLDPTAAWADTGDYLMDGENNVEVVVSTTLGNALIPIHENIRSSGTVWLGPEPIEQEYGLVMPVKVIPYRTTMINLQ